MVQDRIDVSEKAIKPIVLDMTTASTVKNNNLSQGWLIATGQSRESMRSFITRSVQVVLVMALAQGASIFGDMVF